MTVAWELLAGPYRRLHRRRPWSRTGPHRWGRTHQGMTGRARTRRRPVGGVGSNQYRTRGVSQQTLNGGRVTQFRRRDPSVPYAADGCEIAPGVTVERGMGSSAVSLHHTASGVSQARSTTGAVRAGAYRQVQLPTELQTGTDVFVRYSRDETGRVRWEFTPKTLYIRNYPPEEAGLTAAHFPTVVDLTVDHFPAEVAEIEAADRELTALWAVHEHGALAICDHKNATVGAAESTGVNEWQSLGYRSVTDCPDCGMRHEQKWDSAG